MFNCQQGEGGEGFKGVQTLLGVLATNKKKIKKNKKTIHSFKKIYIY